MTPIEYIICIGTGVVGGIIGMLIGHIQIRHKLNRIRVVFQDEVNK